jgi:hypothetical protein
VRRVARAFVSADSYGLVMLLIIVTYLLSVSLRGDRAPSLVLAVQIATVWLALRTSKARSSVRRMADVVLVLAAGAAVAGLFFPTHTAGRGIVALTASFLYFLAPLSIVRHLVFRAEVDQETVLGAVAAYLFFGMFFAFAYRTIGILQPGPFFGANGEGTMSQDLFFSFITLTTTGYGNLVPARNPGQTFAVVEALVGQLFLVTAVAKVVSAWRPKRLRIPPESESGPDEPGTA